MFILQAIVLAIIEGITEFLPISSTGHMIIGSTVMGISSDNFVKTFTVAIQLGAIASVVVLYWKRFFQSFKFYFVLVVGFIPAAVVGLLLNDAIDALLERVDVVGWTLILGGIVLLFIDRWFSRTAEAGSSAVSYPRAIKIGLYQCLALIPGVSRSAATIIGGLAVGLNRRTAAEFSFFLAMPTLIGASLYQLYKERALLSFDDLGMWVVGFIASFLSAFWAVRELLRYISTHDFSVFAWYRIAFGIVVLITWHYDVISWTSG